MDVLAARAAEAGRRRGLEEVIAASEGLTLSLSPSGADTADAAYAAHRDASR
jgi:hypothetical protein